MSQRGLEQSLLEIGSIKLGEFTLKSGQVSPIYIDLRQIISFPDVLEGVADAVWDHHTQTADFICGVPYTALPIATVIAMKHRMPMVMRRKEAKDYGTKKIIEGAYQAGQSCIIIEDVVTTGMSILETIRDLEAAGLRVTQVLAFLDRGQGGADNLKAAGYSFQAALTLKQLAQVLQAQNQISAEQAEAILSVTK